MAVELDRISSLPDDITVKILSNLPIEDRARMRALASNWRSKLAIMLPQVMFDRRCNSDIVNHVLFDHFGPITKFQLCQGSKDIRDIDRWIRHLSIHHPVNVLLLEVSVMQHYTMPSCVFSCQDMIHLNLTGCLLKPPSTFRGFRNLRSLRFDDVILAQDVFDHMIRCCPLLESLTLKDCGGFNQLKIDAPNLLSLHCSGVFKDFSIVNTSKLYDISIDLFIPQVHHSSSNLLKFCQFFANLPELQNLHISWSFLNYLAAGALLELPEPCLYLRFLDMSMVFDDFEEVSMALCLLNSSPVLETLTVTAMGCHNQTDMRLVQSWLYNKRSNCSCRTNRTFTHLQEVKFQRISGVEAQLDFITFLLIRSPYLAKMTVEFLPLEPDAADESLDLAVLQNYFDVFTESLGFRRGPPHLEMRYSNP